MGEVKTKSSIDNIIIENLLFPNMYWMRKMHKRTIQGKFIITSPESSLKP